MKYNKMWVEVYTDERCEAAMVAECAGLLLGRVAATIKQVEYDKGSLVEYSEAWIDMIIRGEIGRVRAEGLFDKKTIDGVNITYTFEYGNLTLSYECMSIEHFNINMGTV